MIKRISKSSVVPTTELMNSNSRSGESVYFSSQNFTHTGEGHFT